MMSEWQLIETAPKLNGALQFFECDVWAERHELVSSLTGEVRKIGRRFPGAVHRLDMKAAPHNPLFWDFRWDASGLDATWKITHWMPVPPPPALVKIEA